MENTKKNQIYSAAVNTAGMMIYYFSFWILTMIISKISHKNYYDVGVFSAAMSYGNIFFSFAAFGVRGFQISDINHEHSDEHYYILRILTCTGATAACVISALVLGYRGDILIGIIVFMLFKAIDAYSDLFYGYSQVYGHLEYAGYSMAVKGVTICGLFTLVLIMTQNLLIAMTSLIVLSLLINVFYDQRKARKLIGLTKMSLKEFVGLVPKTKSLVISCIPLTLISIIMPLLVAVPRLLIERIYSSTEYTIQYGAGYGSEVLGIYTSVTTPTVIISTFVAAAALPLIPSCTRAWQSRNRMKILMVAVLPVLAVVICCIAGVPLVIRFGGEILGILYTSKISGYVDLLVVAVITSCILACVILCNNMLIAMRMMKAMLLFAVAACIVIVFISIPFIKTWGMYGAAYSLALAYAIQLLFQIFFIGHKLLKIKEIKE